jgi:hypothetical protein
MESVASHAAHFQLHWVHQTRTGTVLRIGLLWHIWACNWFTRQNIRYVSTSLTLSIEGGGTTRDPIRRVASVALVGNHLREHKVSVCIKLGMVNVRSLATLHRVTDGVLRVRPICLTPDVELRATGSGPIQRIASVTSVLDWIRVEKVVFVCARGCGMINSWWMTARLWQTSVVEVFIGLRIFEVTCWAMALVVVHQIFACTGFASSFGAIRNVPAGLLAINEFLLKSTVALAVVIINVIARRIVVINTLSIWTAHVSGAVVLVETTPVRTLLAVSHAFRLELRPTTAGRQWLGKPAVDGVAGKTGKFSAFGEDERLFVAPVLRVVWHHHIAALHSLAPLRVAVILA